MNTTQFPPSRAHTIWTRTRLSVKEIVEFIIATYSMPGSRSLCPEGGCVYNAPNGNQCAFALMCENGRELEECLAARSQIQGECAILKEEFDGYVPAFYVDIQRLHDIPEHWDKHGLTPEGRRFADFIIANYTQP
jgi:hypothetical protein